MSKLETLRSLQERIREATGPDRELDAAIFRALDLQLPEQFLNLGIALKWQADGSALMPVGGMQVRYEPPAFTASLDACVALMRDVLPGWRRDSFQRVDHFSVFVSNPDQDQEHAYHSLETHATLIAIVSALIAIEEAKEKADV